MNLSLPDRTVDVLGESLITGPDELAITDLGASLTWRELDARINSLVHLLLYDMGLTAEDHIALLIGNRIEYVELMLAGLLAGLWVTPVNTHLSEEEIDYICRDCQASAVFYDAEHAHLLNADSGYRAIEIGQDWQHALSGAEQAVIRAGMPAGGHMLYTSGTTGRPKGVKRAKPASIGEMLERIRGLGQTFGLTGRGPHMVTGPLYHAAPGMLAIYDLLQGAPMIILPRWHSADFLRCVEDYGVATTHLVPTMFVRLLQLRDQGGATADLSSLRYVLHGAAPISRSVKQRMIEWWGPILTEYWGATESGIITLVDSEDWLSHPGTVGRATPNFEIFVGDDQGNPILEQEGMLFCRHRSLEQVFSYHDDPEKTATAHPQPYVFCIGDIGRVDEEGYVYLSDRKSNMIISGGVNIYPAEVEQALLEHSVVVDCAVFGVPDEEWGEEVRAVVQLQKGIAPSEALAQEIRQFVGGKIARFKIPRAIDFVDELPRNPTGKVLIRQLKEEYGNSAMR